MPKQIRKNLNLNLRNAKKTVAMSVSALTKPVNKEALLAEQKKNSPRFIELVETSKKSQTKTEANNKFIEFCRLEGLEPDKLISNYWETQSVVSMGSEFSNQSNRKRQRISSGHNKTQSIPTQNMFDPLNTLDDQAGPPSKNETQLQPSLTGTSINLVKRQPQVKKPAKTLKVTKADEPSPKTVRPPPIMTREMDTVAFKKLALENKIPCTFKIRGNSQTILTNNLENHELLKNLIKSTDTGGHTFPTSAEKRTVLVLRGVPFEFGSQAVKEDIQLETGEIVEVREMTTDKSKAAGYKLNLYVVSGAKDSMTTVAKLRYVLSHSIKWESLDKRDNITKCGNCQRYGHSGRFCLNKSRCVKCSGSHKSEDCTGPKKSADGPEAFCVNCGKSGHPASYKGCPIRKDLAKAIKQRQAQKTTKESEREQQQQFAQKSSRNFVSPEVSFASHFRAAPASQPTSNANPGNNVSFLSEECKRHFGTDLMTLMTKTNEFAPTYKAIKDPMTQKVALMSFIFELCQN